MAFRLAGGDLVAPVRRVSTRPGEVKKKRLPRKLRREYKHQLGGDPGTGRPGRPGQGGAMTRSQLYAYFKRIGQLRVFYMIYGL
jgi:hypothetical protein